MILRWLIFDSKHENWKWRLAVIFFQPFDWVGFWHGLSSDIIFNLRTVSPRTTYYSFYWTYVIRRRIFKTSWKKSLLQFKSLASSMAIQKSWLAKQNALYDSIVKLLRYVWMIARTIVFLKTNQSQKIAFKYVIYWAATIGINYIEIQIVEKILRYIFKRQFNSYIESL